MNEELFKTLDIMKTFIDVTGKMVGVKKAGLEIDSEHIALLYDCITKQKLALEKISS